MDKQAVYLELKKLEKELVEAFSHFRMIFNKLADPRKQLSNQEIYDKIQGEYDEYHKDVEEVKKKTIEIMKRIQEKHDKRDYHQVLSNIGVKSRYAESGSSTSGKLS